MLGGVFCCITTEVLIDFLTFHQSGIQRHRFYIFYGLIIFISHVQTLLSRDTNIDMFLSFLDSSSLLCTCLITAIVVILTLTMFRLFSRKNVADLDKKYVLITGCDSGFGQETAIRLDKMGVCVLATCLTKEGEQSLRSVTSDRLKSFQLDVTNSQQIEVVYGQVKGLLPSGQGEV